MGSASGDRRARVRRHGHYLAGRDDDRLADINDALRHPDVRAIFCTTGGKGCYRIAHGLDFDAARRDPKPLIGFSDITTLHLALWNACHGAGLCGPAVGWGDGRDDVAAARLLRNALMEPCPITVHQDDRELTVRLTSSGTASGVLLGGTLGVIAKAVGWTCPSFAGAILLIEAIDVHLGEIDSSLTQLMRSGVLDGVQGVAVGRFVRCGVPARGLFARLRDQPSDRWTFIDVLTDRLSALGVPVLGGLPIGHGPTPITVPLGSHSILDADAGTLTVGPAVA